MQRRKRQLWLLRSGGAGIDVIAGGPICGFAAMKESILPLLNGATELVHFACHGVLHEDSDLIKMLQRVCFMLPRS